MLHDVNAIVRGPPLPRVEQETARSWPGHHDRLVSFTDTERNQRHVVLLHAFQK